MSSRKRKQPPTAAVMAPPLQPAATVDRPAPTAPKRQADDVVDDGGNLSFISLSKYGALEDEDEVSVMVSQHVADRAEQRARRKEEQRRRKQQEDEAVAVKAAAVTRHNRAYASRPASGSGHKRSREEAKELDKRSEPQPIEDRNDAAAATQPAARPVPTTPAPAQLPPSPAPPSPPPLLSRFAITDTKLVANSDGSYRVRLQAGEQITFHGSVDLRVEYGYVRCNNHILSPSSPHPVHQLHSPAWHPTALLSIEHYSHTGRRPSAIPADDDSIITLSPSTSPHRLHSNSDPTSSYLPIHIPAFHSLLQQSAASYARQPMAALSVPDAWRAFLAEYVVAAAKPVSFLLCGGRNTGKSTLSRLVVNGLLNVCRRVLYVDVDVGQSECTPPSMLSLTLLSAPLLSPPHCHLALPASSLTFNSSSTPAPQTLLAFHSGDVSYTQDPAGYLQHASLLWQRVEEERRQRKGELLPVVVNTAGWIKGVGGVVLAELIDRINPQHVLYLGEPQADDIPPVPPLSSLHVLPRYSATVAVAGAGTSVALSADKSRTLSLLAYFLQRLCLPVSFLTAASSLASLRPYRVPFAAVCLQLLPPNERLAHSLYLQAFNATLVALCTSDTAHSISTIETSGGVRIVVASPSPMLCLGLAIVRAIDASNRHLYLLTPLPLSLMRQVNVLVRGTMELPSVLVYQREQDGRGQPYMPNSALSAASGSGSVGGRKGVARKRLAAG